MNTEQTNVAIDATVSNQQLAEQPLQDEKQESRKYYLRLARQMCPRMEVNQSDIASLCTLKRRTGQFVEMLALFERSWVDEIPVLQKACMTYLSLDNIPRKERQQVIDAWSKWSDFQFRLSRYRRLITLYMEYNQNVRNELKMLVSPAKIETLTEPQEINQKGGI